MIALLIGSLGLVACAAPPADVALARELHVRCEQLAERVEALERRVVVLEDAVAYHEALVAVRVPPEQAAAVHAALDAARAGVDRATETVAPAPQGPPTPTEGK